MRNGDRRGRTSDSSNIHSRDIAGDLVGIENYNRFRNEPLGICVCAIYTFHLRWFTRFESYSTIEFNR